MSSPDWLHVTEGTAPLIVTMPHAGTVIPPELEERLASPWLARKDADWWIDRLYDFVGELGATVVRTGLSRTAIDVNRDPSGLSLYPGQATTELCPTTTFDGEPLYRPGQAPAEAEIGERRALWFDPYHQAVADQVRRLVAVHGAVVLYDAHAIRSRIPRLFEGLLPQFNIGTNRGSTCAPALMDAVARACNATGLSMVVDGRFKGGWTVRHYGHPEAGVHAVQMELACRGYMDDPDDPPSPSSWPAPYEEARTAPMRAALRSVLVACLQFATTLPRTL